MKQTIAFRVDSGSRIGSGHVMRCLTLAAALRESGHNSIFICRPGADSLEEFIVSFGFPVEKLNRDPDFSPSLVDSRSKLLMHRDFLESTQEHDSIETERILSTYRSINTVIVDHYGIFKPWDDYLKNNYKILKIDDLADRPHGCKGLIDQNYYSKLSSRYNGLLPPDSINLLGPKYAILRPQFKNMDIEFRRNRIRPNRVLVSFGGTDSKNYCLSVVKVLLSNFDLEISVLGRTSPEASEAWLQLADEYPGRVRGPNFLADPLPELLWADLYVGAGGSITWERFACGLGGIVFSIAENQVQMSRDLDLAGLQTYAGSITEFNPDHLAETVNRYFTSRDRVNLSFTLRQLVDGLGSDRIIREWGFK